jgi:hypothetical protein
VLCSSVRRRATSGSPCASAATAARCTGSKTQEKLYSISLARSSASSSGTTIQPARQPVMRQALEKLLTETMRSPAS